MRLTDATALPLKRGNPPRWDWETMAATLGRVWELRDDEDFGPGEARRVADSARAWCRRRPHLHVSVWIADGGDTVRVLFSKAAA